MNELATRYSEACTRAGLAALIVAAISFSFAQSLSMLQPLEAFGSYVLARELLAISLEEVTDDEFWNTSASELQRETSQRDKITVDELASLECELTNAGQYVPRRKRSSQNAAAPVDAASSVRTASVLPAPRGTKIPSPPTDLRVSGPCESVEELQRALKSLWDDSKIATARSLSNEVNMELYRWQRSRNRMLMSGEPGLLNLQKLVLLSRQPYTTMTQFSENVRDTMRVTAPYSSDQQSVYVAAMLAEVGLVIIMGYFFLNYRAAQLTNVLTQPGSVFSTLWATLLGRWFYIALLLTPAMAGIHLATKMRGFDGIIALGLATIASFLTASLVVAFSSAHGFQLRNVVHAVRSKVIARLRRKISSDPTIS